MKIKVNYEVWNSGKTPLFVYKSRSDNKIRIITFERLFGINMKDNYGRKEDK